MAITLDVAWAAGSRVSMSFPMAVVSVPDGPEPVTELDDVLLELLEHPAAASAVISTSTGAVRVRSLISAPWRGGENERIREDHSG
jgi:hypothetical protein